MNLLTIVCSDGQNLIKVSTMRRCFLGSPNVLTTEWPMDWFWASNVVLANAMIYFLYKNDQVYKGVPCFQSSAKNTTILKDLLVHVSPGQTNWGKNFPSIVIKPTPIMVQKNLPVFVCDRTNTVVDQVMIFGIRGYDKYGHIIFNSLHPMVGTMWEMGLDINQVLLYSMIDRKPQGRSYNDMIRVANEDVTDPIDLQGFMTIFAKITKDNQLHSLNSLLEKSFRQPLCFDNISIGHTDVLDLYNKQTPRELYKKLQTTLFKIHEIPMNPVGIPKQCQIKLISRVKNRVIEDEDIFIQQVKKRYPGCEIDKIHLEKLTVKEQAHEMQYKTSILIGLDGTGLLNALYMRPCSAVVRLLPWGGDFLSLLDYPEYVWKGGEFKNIALKVGALWYSHNLDTPPAKLYSKRRSGDVDTFIFNAVKQNKSYSEMKTLLAQRFPANIRLNHWKYGLNTILGNTTSVLALLGTVLRDTNNCGLKQ